MGRSAIPLVEGVHPDLARSDAVSIHGHKGDGRSGVHLDAIEPRRIYLVGTCPSALACLVRGLPLGAGRKYGVDQLGHVGSVLCCWRDCGADCTDVVFCGPAAGYPDYPFLLASSVLRYDARALQPVAATAFLGEDATRYGRLTEPGTAPPHFLTQGQCLAVLRLGHTVDARSVAPRGVRYGV